MQRRKDKKANTFDRKVTKPHHQILGKRLKGTEQNSGQLRHLATELRKKTLLPEYERQGKNTKFLDHRFGEKDQSLSAEEKMVIRFKKEREKQFRRGGSFFNLEEEELTHLGASLSSLDDFKDETFFYSDEEEGGTIDAKTVRSSHFGGFHSDNMAQPVEAGDGQESRQKSRHEVMQEIIAKSKMYKMERQREKQEMEEQTEKLDEEFRLLLKQGTFSASKESRHASAEMREKDSFNVLYHELAQDLKGAATDRLKTPDDLLREQKSRLEALERERLRRMHPEEEDLDEEATASAQNKPARSSSLSPSGDALEDDFGDMGETTVDFSRHTDDVAEHEAMPSTVSLGGTDIPFTFDVPESEEVLRTMVAEHSDEEVRLILHRIAVCNSISLAPENRGKMEKFYSVLWSHFEYSARRCPMDIARMDLLSSILFKLAQDMPSVSVSVARHTLHTMSETLHRSLGNGSGAIWPQTEDVMLLQLMGRIFPTSDFRHAVTTGALLFMGQCLALCPLDCTRSALIALALCSIALSYLEPTGRVMPEVVNTITGLLRLAVSGFNTKVEKSDSSLHEKKKGAFYIDCKAVAAQEDLNLLPLLNRPSSDSVFATPQVSAGIIYTTASILSTLSSLYFRSTHLLSYPELFSSAFLLLSTLRTNQQWPPYLQKHLEDVEHKVGLSIQRKLFARHSLIQKKKPTAISMRNPRFQEHYVVGKDYDPDSARAELHKLKRQHKREMKGAARELRKDTAFLQEQRTRKRKKELAERAMNEKRILGLLADQQGELNKLAREAKTQHAFVKK